MITAKQRRMQVSRYVRRWGYFECDEGVFNGLGKLRLYRHTFGRVSWGHANYEADRLPWNVNRRPAGVGGKKRKVVWRPRWNENDLDSARRRAEWNIWGMRRFG